MMAISSTFSRFTFTLTHLLAYTQRVEYALLYLLYYFFFFPVTGLAC